MQTTINQGNNSRVAVRDYYENCNFTINKLQELNNLLEFQKVKQKKIINKFKKPLKIQIINAKNKENYIFLGIFIACSIFTVIFYFYSYISPKILIFFWYLYFSSLLLSSFFINIIKFEIKEDRFIFSKNKLYFKYDLPKELYFKDIRNLEIENNLILGKRFFISTNSDKYPNIDFKISDMNKSKDIEELLRTIISNNEISSIIENSKTTNNKKVV